MIAVGLGGHPAMVWLTGMMPEMGPRVAYVVPMISPPALTPPQVAQSPMATTSLGLGMAS